MGAPFFLRSFSHEMADPKYKRILLKLSGEALCGEQEFGIVQEAIQRIAREVKGICDLGVSVALIVGGGNIFRGLAGSAAGMDRASADYIGMLATVINGLALQDHLERCGVQTRVMSAIEMSSLAEPYIRRRALRHLAKGRCVIFVAGTGNPYMTTDTAAALRANEIHAEVILKATNVDGIYDSDPRKNPDARKFKSLTYMDVLQRGLSVMDSTAIAMCKENDMPIIVFDLGVEGNIKRVVLGDELGTTVTSEGVSVFVGEQP